MNKDRLDYLYKNSLHLPMKAKWYDMIFYDNKREEYRTYNQYWSKRILKGHYQFICLRYGYTKRVQIWTRTYFRIGKGKIRWGAPSDENVIIIGLGRLLYEGFIQQ